MVGRLALVGASVGLVLGAGVVSSAAVTPAIEAEVPSDGVWGAVAQLSLPEVPARAPGDEIVELRSQHSSTVVGDDGSMVTSVSPVPIHFRDGHSWVPIDSSLVRDGRGWRNAANSVGVRLPASLRDAVEVTEGDRRISMSMVETPDVMGQVGDVAPEVAGETAVFGAGGVEVRFTAMPSGVKEEIVLADARSVPERFEFEVALSAGLVLVGVEAGGALVVDERGEVVFTLPAPFAFDAAGAVVPVEMVVNDSSVVLRLDPGWMSAPERVWPVVVDPTVVFGAAATCPIASNSSALWWCSRWDLPVGSSSTVQSRALLDFGDVSDAIPLNSTVMDAELSLEVANRGNGAAMAIGAYPLEASFDDGATWTTRDGSVSWVSAGADFDAAAGVVNPDANQWGRQVWSVTTVVQDWVRRDRDSFGFVVKQVVEDGSNTMTFLSPNSSDPDLYPTLTVWHTWDLAGSGDGVWEQRLTDRSSVSVDVATGNVSVDVADFVIAGTGLDAGVRRSYDSLRALQHGAFGLGWVQTEGNGTYLQFTDSGAPVLRSAQLGWPKPFTADGSGGWDAPAGLNADLTSSGSTWTLTFRRGGEVWEFEAGHATIGGRPAATLVSRTDRNGNTIEFSYDYAVTAPDGTPRQTSTVDTQQRDLSFFNGFYVNAVDDVAGGRSVEYGYSGARLTTVTDAGGADTSYDYDTGSRLNRIVDPSGHETRIVYETTWPHRATSVTRVTNPSTGTGSTWTFDYDSWAFTGGRWVSTTTVTDPNGNDTAYTFDTRNRVVDVVDALGRNRETSWTPNNDIATLTDGLSAITTLTYDATTNNLMSIQSPDDGPTPGRATTFAYDDPTHPYYPSSETDPQGNQLAYTYDTAGNLTTSTNDLTADNQIVIDYNADGTIAARTDAGGSCTAPVTRCTTYTYTWNYNGSTRTTLASVTVTPPAPLGAETTTFDMLGRRASHSDGKGQLTHYTWDDMDRIVRVTFDNDTGCTSTATCVTYTYDDDGNLTSRLDASGTTTIVYDTLDRPTHETRPSSATTISYDPAGNITAFTDTNGTITYGYDAANQVISLAEPGGSCAAPVSACTTFGYDDNGQRNHIEFPNDVTVTIDYDPSGRERAITAVDAASTVIVGYDYTYTTVTGDDTALVATVTDTRLDETTTYTYDALNRLTHAVTRDTTNTITDQHAYTYDAASNRTSTTHNTTTTHSAFNQANQLCWTAPTAGTCASPPTGAVTYTYDANGNQTGTNTGTAATYNPLDQTTSVTPAGGTPIPMTYADIDQTQRLTAGTTTYTNTPLGITHQNNGASQHYIRDPHGNLIAVRTGGVSHYYHHDRLGSIVAITDNTGTPITRYTYDPYGQPTATGTLTQPWQYASGHHDTTTGHTKFGTRYYQPNHGRWTQPDPTGFPDGPNNYIYVNNNPTNYIDPTGRSWEALGDALGHVSTLSAGVCAIGVGKACIVSGLTGGAAFLSYTFAGQRDAAVCALGSTVIGAYPGSRAAAASFVAGNACSMSNF